MIQLTQLNERSRISIPTRIVTYKYRENIFKASSLSSKIKNRKLITIIDTKQNEEFLELSIIYDPLLLRKTFSCSKEDYTFLVKTKDGAILPISNLALMESLEKNQCLNGKLSGNFVFVQHNSVLTPVNTEAKLYKKIKQISDFKKLPYLRELEQNKIYKTKRGEYKLFLGEMYTTDCTPASIFSSEGLATDVRWNLNQEQKKVYVTCDNISQYSWKTCSYKINQLLIDNIKKKNSDNMLLNFSTTRPKFVSKASSEFDINMKLDMQDFLQSLRLMGIGRLKNKINSYLNGYRTSTDFVLYSSEIVYLANLSVDNDNFINEFFRAKANTPFYGSLKELLDK